MTCVINIREAPSKFQFDSRFVYIGRKRAGFDGYFGNPVFLPEESQRLEVLNAYRRYAVDRMLCDPVFRGRLQSLHGKTLVCYCKPKLCHGDVIAELVDSEFLPLDAYVGTMQAAFRLLDVCTSQKAFVRSLYASSTDIQALFQNASLNTEPDLVTICAGTKPPELQKLSYLHTIM